MVAVVRERKLRSPVHWVGGKHYSAHHILDAFPPDNTYSTFVDTMGGAAHVLIQKPLYSKHIEVYNDLNSDLVNFWRVARRRTAELQARLDQHLYSRETYYEYLDDLRQEGYITDELERAMRWFYVNRSAFSGQMDHKAGWSYTVLDNSTGSAHAFRSATALLDAVSQRLRNVQIDNRDFEDIIKAYGHAQTLFYVDPPYIGCERYYKQKSTGLFSMKDHERLARLLNQTKARVALSYYDHPLLAEWYPDTKWRRITWQTPKHSKMAKDGEAREIATELLLINYPEAERKEGFLL